MRCDYCNKKKHMAFVGTIRLLETVIEVLQCRKCKMIVLVNPRTKREEE